MKNRLLLLFVFTSLLVPAITHAQSDLEIKDDTIRVSPTAFPLLTFMSEIRDYQALCNDYKIASSTNTLTIRPNASKPTPYCLLIVSEGSKNSPRQHRFVLVFDKNADPSEQIHDYSTKDLLEQRIAYLNRMRSGGDDGEEKTSSKKKSRKERAKEKAKEEEESAAAAAKELAKAKTKVKKPETPKAPDVAKETKKVTKQESDDEEATPAQENKQKFEAKNTGSTATEVEETTDKDEIKNVPSDLLDARVKLKINGFYRACELLCAKTDVQNTIKYGMKLFDNDEEVLVETTNGRTNEKSQTKIRQYLNHLALLNYKKVEMTASNIKFVSKFHLAPDGKWHASAMIIQDFKGFRDNRQVYSDQTNKTFDIIVNTFEEVKDGKTITKFDIFLGNISVTNVPS